MGKAPIIISLIVLPLISPMIALGAETATSDLSNEDASALIRKYQRTINHFDKTSALSVETATSELCYGNLFALHGQYEKSIAAFDKAVELDPHMAQAYSHRAAALLRWANTKMH